MTAMEKWEEIRKHIYVSGRVQGVGFRFRTQQLARGFGLTGWVRNLYDGRVEMELQGSEADMDHLFERLNQDRYIRIDGLQTERIPTVDEAAFQVRY